MTSTMVLLGSTGSIGAQALDVAEHRHIRVSAMAAGKRVEPFEAQIRRFRPERVAMFDETAAADLRVRIADLNIPVLSGIDGVCELATDPAADTVLNAVTGVAGLRPTMAAVESGHNVALANKETLVAGGALVTDAVKRHGVKLLPVDSEHSAIFQCLQGAPDNRALTKLILTASGGPFFGKTAEQLRSVTLADALRHPNWNMGTKITIDSATMMNKGLELIEACWLFDVPPSRVDIVVHRESVVHSLVEYDDGSVIGQFGVPDMRIAIQYALTYPSRYPSPVPSVSLTQYGTLSFFEPDHEAFPSMNICRRAMEKGGLTPAAVNGANEQAVALFVAGTIGLTDFPRLVASVLERDFGTARDIADVLAADAESRAHVLSLV